MQAFPSPSHPGLARACLLSGYPHWKAALVYLALTTNVREPLEQPGDSALFPNGGRGHNSMPLPPPRSVLFHLRSERCWKFLSMSLLWDLKGHTSSLASKASIVWLHPRLPNPAPRHPSPHLNFSSVPSFPVKPHDLPLFSQRKVTCSSLKLSQLFVL